MKQRYIQAFGNAYMCDSPKHNRLMRIFEETCRQHNILWKTEEVFAYLQEFETKYQQLSLF